MNMTHDGRKAGVEAFSDADRALIDRTLHFVAERASRVTGNEFFVELVKYLGEALDVAYAFCDKIDHADDKVVNTLALYAHGKISENISYNLKDTPCENVIGRTICCYAEKVQQQFPGDQLLVDLDAESYAGIPLWAADGSPLGLIAIMDNKPLRSPDLVKTLLQIVAVRAGSELERVQFFLSLQSSEQRFADFAEVSSDWFWEMDENLRFSYFSEQMEKYAGIPATLLLGKTREETGIPNVDPDAWANHLRDLSAHRRFDNFVHPRTKSDGEIFWASINGMPIFDDANVFLGYRGTARDITKHKQIEDALRKSEQSLSTLIQSQTDMICRFTPDGVLNFVNKSYAGFVGKEPNDLLGKPIFDDVPKEEHGTLRAFLNKLSQKEPIAMIENRNINKHGETRRFEWFSHAHFNTEGKVTEIQSVGRDVTEIRIAKEESEKSNKAKSDFLAAMSHDLRTPLNAIMGFSDMMRQKTFGPLGDEHYDQYADDIHSSGLFLISLINDILDLSKIEAGKYELFDEPLDVSSTIKDCLLQLKNMAETHNLSLISDVPSGMPRLLGDERVMIQILNNLLSNAIKFSSDAGRVDVNAYVDEGNSIVLSVIDTGIGMSDEDIAKAQNAFEQADGTHSKRHEGTGLGLYLCHNFMTLFGGTLDIESEADAGTMVTLRFPAERTIQPV